MSMQPGYEFTDEGPRLRALPVDVPGNVWDDFLNPDVSSMEDELGLTGYRDVPFTRKRGKGVQHRYRCVPRETILDLAEYIYDRGDMLLGQSISDPYDPCEKASRATYRRAMKLATELREVAR